MDIHATLSLFTIPSGETHVSTNWYFSNDSDFATTIHESLADTINKTNYDVTIGGTGPIYVRAQVVTNMGSIAIADASVVALTTTPLPNINILGYPHSVATSPVINIGNFNSSVSGNTHVSTNWIIFNSQNDIVWSSLNNTVQLTTITIPNGVLVENTAYVLKVNYVGSIEDSPFSRLPLSVGIADGTLVPIIATPTLNVSGAPNAVPLAPALFGGAFSTIVGSDIHVSTDWIVEDMGGSTVWSSIGDTVNKTTITVPINTLLNNVSYRFILRYNGASVVSNYRTVTASTVAIGLGYWTTASPIVTERRGHSGSMLSGGRAFIVGGQNSLGNRDNTRLYLPTTQVWVSRFDYPIPIRSHVQAPINASLDEILVIGGIGNAGSVNLVHKYNPASNTWLSRAPYISIIHDHSCSILLAGTQLWNGTILSQGGVLVVGGVSGSTVNHCNIYNTALNTWITSAAYPMVIADHSQSTLHDGTVLVSGGVSSGPSLRAECYIYDPTTNLWTQTGSLPAPIEDHAQCTLANGRVLITGGVTTGAFTTELSHTYNPAVGTWSPAADYPFPVEDHVLINLDDGSALGTCGLNAGNTPINIVRQYWP